MFAFGLYSWKRKLIQSSNYGAQHKKSKHAVLSVILVWLYKCAAPRYFHLPYGGKLSLCLYYVKLLVLCRRNKLLCRDSKKYKPRSYLLEFAKQDTNF